MGWFVVDDCFNASLGRQTFLVPRCLSVYVTTVLWIRKTFRKVFVGDPPVLSFGRMWGVFGRLEDSCSLA